MSKDTKNASELYSPEMFRRLTKIAEPLRSNQLQNWSLQWSLWNCEKLSLMNSNNRLVTEKQCIIKRAKKIGSFFYEAKNK